MICANELNLLFYTTGVRLYKDEGRGTKIAVTCDSNGRGLW